MGSDLRGPSASDVRLALEAADIGAWTWNAATGMVASDRCWSLWGVQSADEREATDWTIHVHPDDRDCVVRSLHEAVEKHGSMEADYRVLNSAGAVRWLASRGRVLGTSVIGITEDVSARIAAEQAGSALGAIVAGSYDAIIGKTLEGTITSWNRAAENIFGYAASEVLGRNITVLIPSDRLDEEDQILGAVKSGRGVSDYRSRRRRKDGTLIDVALTVSPVHDRHGQIVGASKIARDITALKRAQEAEREAARQKDTFLAILAHELRNPLAPIRSAIRVLELKGSDAPEARTAREIVDRQVDHLVHLVDDLLDVSRITLGRIRLRLTPIDLRDVVQEALTTSGPLLRERGHQVTFTTPADQLLVNGDWVRLVQVVANLLNNAARYTPPGGQVHLTVGLDDPSRAYVSITDTGVGISPEEIPRVFDLFVQVKDPVGDGQGGLGVGLALARNLVELHGGTLVASSEGLGRGSRFIVTLPRLAASSVVTAPLHSTSSERKPDIEVPLRFRVLIVDDNSDAADSQAMLLRLIGHEVWTAYDGPHALLKAQEHRPDVVLLDLGMPGMDGFEAVRQLRGIPEISGALLVAQTGWGQPEVREKTARAGFDAHITKPADLATLTKLLESVPLLLQRRDG